MKRKINLIFIIIYMMILVLPYLFAHRDTQGRISTMENRTLAGYPHLFEEEGKINITYPQQFEDWLDDNLRGRSVLMKVNATLQYRLFQNVIKSDILVGKDGWTFTNAPDQIEEFQRTNLMPQETMDIFAKKMQKLSDYLTDKNITFYYFQCYSKEAVYPEQYNQTVKQLGNVSRTEQIMETLRRKTDINLIDSKKRMEEEKEKQLIYFQFVDSIHWNEEGAYWGYRELLEGIQKDFPEIAVLDKSNYQIREEESSISMYGFPYPYQEVCPIYEVNNPKAAEITESVKEEWNWLHVKEHTHMYHNENIAHGEKILLIGDSYIRMFLKDDIAESFSDTLSVDWMNIPLIEELVEIYKPDIVVLECADSKIGNIVELADQMEFLEN